MIKRSAVIVTIFALLLPTLVTATKSGKKYEAIASAEAWLKLVDEGRYAHSWKEASQFFKEAVTQGQWEGSMRGVRQPLGATVTRALKSSYYSTTLPGAPDGEYVVIQYATEFTNKKTSIETVTPMLDRDGKWRVSGYYIK